MLRAYYYWPNRVKTVPLSVVRHSALQSARGSTAPAEQTTPTPPKNFLGYDDPPYLQAVRADVFQKLRQVALPATRISPLFHFKALGCFMSVEKSR